MGQSGSQKVTATESKIIWVDRDNQVDDMVAHLAGFDEVAVDTEFHRERTYFPRLALIQFGVAGEAFLVDPLSVDTLLLAPLLQGGVELVFHALEQDVDILERATGVRAKKVFDTQVAAGFLGLSRPSLAHLADRMLSVELPKADRLSDWTQRPLSEAQLKYAASDVTHLLELKRMISAELDATERLGWVYDELDQMLFRRRGPTDPELAWIRIKECRGLKGTARKIAKSVAEWRELRAMESDIPPRYLLGDLTIASLAQLAPKSKTELLRVRGVDPRQLANGVDVEILAAVQAGIALEKVPEYPHSPEEASRGVGAVVSLAMAWLSQRCTEERLDPQIVGSRDDVTSLIAGERDARLASGWRFELVGRELMEISRGEMSLTGGRNGAVVASRPAPAPASEPL